MKRAFAIFGFAVLAVPAFAQQRVVDPNGSTLHLFQPKDFPALEKSAPPGARGGSNLSYHGGPVITHAAQVSIFWGTEWGTQSNPSALASSMMAFFANFGTTGEYNVITQYSGIQQTNLTNVSWFDGSAPPTNVTDTALQNEVKKYLNANRGGIADASTIYGVFLPSTSYSSSGGSTSCGGPNLQYCAYHGHFSFNGVDVKYSSLPYPSCGGCQWTGFTTAQNLDHFACHETREAVTDPDLNAWYDHSGNEADDKCAWSPAPFIDSGFGYQWEWSNQDHSCVKTK